MEVFLIIYSLLLTVISESLFLSILSSKKYKNSYIIFIFTNLITNVAAQFTINALIYYFSLNYYIAFFPVEAAVFLGEFVFYYAYFKSLQIPVFSLIGNLFTFSLSFIINAVIENLTLIIVLPLVAVIIFILATYGIKKIYENIRAKRET